MSDDRKALADEIGQRLEGAYKADHGPWVGACLQCGKKTLYVTHRGFSCADVNQCSFKGKDLEILRRALDARDRSSESPEGSVYREDEQAYFDAPTFDHILGPALDELNHKKLQPVDAVPTHLPIWNRISRDEGGGVGLARGWHVIVAGNTGMGKSLLALNLASHAIRCGEKAAVISLEMSQAQTVTRFMSIFAQENVKLLEWGKGYDEEAAHQVKCRMEEHYERTGACLLTNRRPISDLSDIVNAMRSLHEEHGVRYFITDYLQLAWTGNATALYDRITEVSHAVRSAAHDLNVVSIGVSQFKRATSSVDERPRVQGLMGGSSLENDADQIALLDHTTHKQILLHSDIVKLVVAKNRHGPVGEIPLAWDYNTLRCYETDASRFDDGKKA